MYPEQSNTRAASSLPVVANEDLTGKKSRLGVLINNAGVLNVGLPSAITNETPVLILDEAASGELAPVAALDPSSTVRVRLRGTCLPGDVAVMADTATAADKGMVRELPAALGTYLQVGVFMESGVDGQLVEMLPINVGKSITV